MIGISASSIGATPIDPAAAGAAPANNVAGRPVAAAAGAGAAAAGKLDDEELIPAGIIKFQDADLLQVLDIYQDLTGRTVLLPSDDASVYEPHFAEFLKRLAPVGEDEQNLVQSLADTEWRLLRIPALEMGIYAVGRVEFAELFANEDEAVRKHLIEAKIFLAYQRQLNNLSIQEGRLRRQREKDTAALGQLQDKRKRQAQARLDKAAREYILAVHEGRHEAFEPAARDGRVE